MAPPAAPSGAAAEHGMLRRSIGSSVTNSVEFCHGLGAGWCSVGTWSASAPPAADDRSHRPAECRAHLLAGRTRYCLVRTGRGTSRGREAVALDPAAAA